MKASKETAGYMELAGAKKDANCSEVEGNVSTRLGCCNYFEPKSEAAQEFRCGMCEYVHPSNLVKLA